MIALVADWLNRLEELHSDAGQAIADLPLDALDWKPAPEMNSICVLVVHLTGSARYWIGDVASQEPSNRVRNAEFAAHGLSAGELTQRLDRTLAYARQACEPLTADDLEARRRSPRHGEEVSVAWALLHALEHTAAHVGQIQIMRDLWRQTPASANPQ